jgi:hypothetical protein
MWASNRLLLGDLDTSGTREEGRREIVPMLPPDETRRLLTFEKPCRRDEDCDAPLVCLRGKWMWKAACVASQCATDADCSEGLSCYPVRAGERVVRRCGAPGRAKEGELCVELPLEPELGCAPGLMCIEKRCRRSCQPQAPQGCPAGHFCGAADGRGTVCLPTCEGQACPEGQRCVALKHGASVCARVHGADCQLEPCPEGWECEVSAREARRTVGMRCLRVCDSQARPCPEGFSCMGGQCLQQCVPEVPGVCGPMEECAGGGRDHPGWCVLDPDK